MANMLTVLEHGFIKLADALFAHWPGPGPSMEQLHRCHLIAHRGDHRDGSVKENTLEAFDRAAAAGVWGLEMDIRWTLDLVPVILHDPDLARMYQDRRRVDRLRFADLRRRFSAIPTLAEVVERYGSSRHLMLEVKDDCWPDPDRQNRILAKILKPLQPVTDFHFMALNPAVLAPLTGVPGNALLPIAYYWPKKMLRQVQNGPWGGLCGHYALMGDRLVQRLKSRGKQVGTGYADSPGCLFRELQRGVDWIFSNNAVQMQRVIRTALGGRQPQ